MSKRLPVLFVILFLAGFEIANGQDDHYWAQQYGAVSTIMGGAMVGGVRDNSAIYYNPGAIGFLNQPSLSVDANIYRVDKIFIKNGAGDNINLNSAQLSIYPEIISGLVNLKWIPKVRFAYTVLTRNYGNVLMNTRYTSYDFYLDTLTHKRQYVGAFDYTNQMNEQWFGVAASMKLTDHLSIGITWFGTYRSQTYQLTNDYREITRKPSAWVYTTYNVDETVKYKTFGTLFKIGLAWEKNRWKAGLTVTTPSMKFYGRGEIQREISIYSGSDVVGDTNFSFIILDRQTHVKTKYPSPFSIAAGVEYNSPKTRLACSFEFFTGIKGYSMLNPPSDPFVYPPEIKDTAELKHILDGFLVVKNSMKPVFNIGIGWEQQLTEKFFLMLGANTDFSSYRKLDDGDLFLHGAGLWDLYHVATGLSYKTPRQMTTLGFSYSFSPAKTIDRYTDINPDSKYDNANLWPQSFAVVIGFTYYIPKHE